MLDVGSDTHNGYKSSRDPQTGQLSFSAHYSYYVNVDSDIITAVCPVGAMSS